MVDAAVTAAVVASAAATAVDAADAEVSAVDAEVADSAAIAHPERIWRGKPKPSS